VKGSYILFAAFIAAATIAGPGCVKNTYLYSAVNINPSVVTMLQNKWVYQFWSSCPPNPSMGAPCFEYTQADTSLFGDGTVSLNIGTDNKIYRVEEGTFKQFPFSYLYSSHNDTLGYQVISDSAFVLLDSSNNVIDTAKITALTDHLLVLKYATRQLGYCFQVDSLGR
jgi:hypothetical protein